MIAKFSMLIFDSHMAFSQIFLGSFSGIFCFLLFHENLGYYAKNISTQGGPYKFGECGL